jgi:hypothetical protein
MILFKSLIIFIIKNFQNHNNLEKCRKLEYTIFKKLFFFYKGIELWNELPTNLRLINNFKIFKRELCNLFI